MQNSFVSSSTSFHSSNSFQKINLTSSSSSTRFLINQKSFSSQAQSSNKALKSSNLSNSRYLHATLIRCFDSFFLINQNAFSSSNFFVMSYKKRLVKMLEVRQKQKEIELEALQIAFSKSISTIESFVSRASLHTFLSTIYQLFIFTSFAIVDFCYETSIKDLTTCSKCDLTLIDWKFKRNSLKAHKRQSFNCSIAQALSKDQVFSISLNSTSIESCFEAITQSIVETSTSTTFFVAFVQTSKEETSTSTSNKSKTSFLQSISSLFDIDENFTSKFFTQLEAFSSQTQRSSTKLKCFEIELFANDLTQLDIDETLLRARYSINNKRSNWNIKVKDLRQRFKLLWLYNAIEFAWVSSLQL